MKAVWQDLKDNPVGFLIVLGCFFIFVGTTILFGSGIGIITAGALCIGFSLLII